MTRLAPDPVFQPVIPSLETPQMSRTAGLWKGIGLVALGALVQPGVVHDPQARDEERVALARALVRQDSLSI